MACTEHRNAFVRKNAVLAIMYLYTSPNGEHLLQDAPDTIYNVGLWCSHPKFCGLLLIVGSTQQVSWHTLFLVKAGHGSLQSWERKGMIRSCMPECL